jgi:mannose-6-phosphate isomerase-like protein (cupin superfamily)
MRHTGKVPKGWGHELIFESNDLYCGKLLCFDRAGARSSMHFHLAKDETWHVISGSFVVRWIETEDASECSQVLEKGDTWRNTPGMPHQLEALEPNSVIVEVSTPDSVGDNFRIAPGDSQKI